MLKDNLNWSWSTNNSCFSLHTQYCSFQTLCPICTVTFSRTLLFNIVLLLHLFQKFWVSDTVEHIWTKVFIVPHCCFATLTSLPLALPDTHSLRSWQAEKSGQGELEATAVQIAVVIVNLRWRKWREKMLGSRNIWVMKSVSPKKETVGQWHRRAGHIRQV